MLLRDDRRAFPLRAARSNYTKLNSVTNCGDFRWNRWLLFRWLQTRGWAYRRGGQGLVSAPRASRLAKAGSSQPRGLLAWRRRARLSPAGFSLDEGGLVSAPRASRLTKAGSSQPFCALILRRGRIRQAKGPVKLRRGRIRQAKGPVKLRRATISKRAGPRFSEARPSRSAWREEHALASAYRSSIGT